MFCGELMLEDERYESIRSRVNDIRWQIQFKAWTGWNKNHPDEYAALERKEVRLTRCLCRAVTFREKVGKWV